MTAEPNELLLAVADDWLAAHPPDDTDPLDADEVYDWLVTKAAEVGEF